MLTSRLRSWMSILASTPLHPQWLLRLGMKKGEMLDYANGLTLDVGCASRWPESMLPPNSQYMALDYPPTADNLYSSQPDVFADAAALPFVSNSVDTVLYFEVLEHVVDPRQTLEEIARVLKPGGRLIMSMPFLYPMHDEPHDFQRFTLHGLVRELSSCGLDITTIKPNLNSAASAGLMACLALSGMMLEAIKMRSPSVLFAPLVVVSIPLINVTSWCIGLLMPNWNALSAGHFAVATKP